MNERSRQSQAGFSLLEMTMSMVVLITLLAGVIGLLSRFEIVSSHTRQSLHLTQNVRAAFDSIVRDTRLAGAGLQTIGHGIVTAEDDRLSVRGNFNRIATTATAVNPGGVLSVVSSSGFAAGQSVALWDPANGSGALTSVTQVATGSLTVSTTVTAITAGATLANFGPGTTVDVMQRVTYTIADGVIIRAEGPELNPASATVAELAEHVLDDEGVNGLTLRYFGIDPGNPLDPADDVEVELSAPFVPSAVKRVEVAITARTERPRSETEEHEFVTLKESIRPRGQ